MNRYLSLVKFSHTLFALPFALLGFFLAISLSDTAWSMTLMLKVIACMVFARSAAMAFNRYSDRDIDALNPRTAQREIPRGVISPQNALVFVILNAVLFCITTFFINWICFVLSPLALLVILGYSYTKRFTALCHFVLGLGLALAPIGAYLAVTGYFSEIPIIYSLSVLCWVAGFDVMYALQDVSFDTNNHLKSIPVLLGERQALRLSVGLHLVAALLIIYAGWQSASQYDQLSLLHWVGAAIFIGLLVYQHIIVKPGKLDRINLAFFTTNGIASVLFSTFFISDLLG